MPAKRNSGSALVYDSSPEQDEEKPLQKKSKKDLKPKKALAVEEDSDEDEAEAEVKDQGEGSADVLKKNKDGDHYLLLGKNRRVSCRPTRLLFSFGRSLTRCTCLCLSGHSQVIQESSLDRYPRSEPPFLRPFLPHS